MSAAGIGTGLNQLLVSAEYVPGKKEAISKPTTMEAYHHQKMKSFEIAHASLEELQTELAAVEEKLLDVPLFTDEWRVLTDQIEALRKQITVIETDQDRLTYFLDVGDVLFQYYDAQENLANGNILTESTSLKPPTMLKNSILNYFAAAAVEEEAARWRVGVSGESVENTTAKSTAKSNAKSIAKTGGGVASQVYGAGDERSRASDIDSRDGLNRDKMLEKYLALVDPESIKSGILPGSGVTPGWGYCRACGVEMTFYQNEATMGCSRCGHEEFILIDSEKPSYKDPPREITYFAYKKINHFNEWLAQFQAKENTDIPQDVLESIISELLKQRITDPKKIKAEKIREILQKLKLSKMYDHVQQIKNLIQHQMTNLTLSKEMEEKLQHMFKEILPSFIKYCPKGRSNFLSYPYVLYKMCQLLEMDEFLPCFQLLKSREKLYQQDQVWQKICAEMRWQFIRSI